MPTTRERGRVDRSGRVLAGVTVAYGVAAVVLGFVLDSKIRASAVEGQRLPDAAGLGAWGASALVGATLLVRQPANPVGWLFSGLGATLATVGLVVIVPVGAGLAVGRYHLHNVDRILSRAVTAGSRW